MDTIKLRIQTISDDFDATSPTFDNHGDNYNRENGNCSDTDNVKYNNSKNDSHDSYSYKSDSNNKNNNNTYDDYSSNGNYDKKNENNYKNNGNKNNNNNYDNNDKNSDKNKGIKKVKKTNNKKKIEHNLISMGICMIRKEGISSLFSGLGAAMYSTIFSSAFFCIIYEMIKRQSTV